MADPRRKEDSDHWVPESEPVPPDPPIPLHQNVLSSRSGRSTGSTAFVNVDASDTYVRGRRLNPAGAHSDHIRPKSAHLLLTLADYSR